MQKFVNVERGPLAFAWSLLTRPGSVAREYVEGKRRRHYSPFATLVVLVGMMAPAVNLSGFRILAQDGLPSAPTHLFQRHFNRLLLVQLFYPGPRAQSWILGAIAAAIAHAAIIAAMLAGNAAYETLAVR
jgi:hypothetical protein